MSFYETVEYEMWERLDALEMRDLSQWEKTFVGDVVEQYERAWLLDDLSWRKAGTVGKVWTAKQRETIKEILDKQK
jgi:hypothetical protein